MHSPSRIQFGHFEFDLESGELWKRGRKTKLAPQPARLLALLANSSGCLVTRESIQRQLWGEGTFIDFEHGLNFCIRKIRAVLGDSAKRPKYIETLPRRGYRFIAATTTIGSGPHSNGDVNRSDAGAVNRFVSPSSETARIEAYEHYAAARIRFAQVGKESLEAARQGFERAIALQPDYALAHSGLGASYALRPVSRRDPDDLERAQSHLLQALELDPELAEPIRGCVTCICAGGSCPRRSRPESVV